MNRLSLLGLGVSLCAARFALGAPVAQKDSITLDGARRVVAAAVRAAQERHAAGAIAVVDDGGNLVCVERLDGTFTAGAQVSIGKARTAAMFNKPTKAFEDIVNKGRTAMVALPDFTPLQGGVPIVVDGRTVGAIGVSGAHSAQEDEEIATAGAAALADASPAVGASPGATYIPAQRVAAGFGEGRVGVALYEGGAVDCAVHASRRDAPGLAEAHETEADVMYIVSGSATLVTGGALVSPAAGPPGEPRAERIDGGETRTISAGDVVVIPAGVPHWFRDVSGSVEYCLVKVR